MSFHISLLQASLLSSPLFSSYVACPSPFSDLLWLSSLLQPSFLLSLCCPNSSLTFSFSSCLYIVWPSFLWFIYLFIYLFYPKVPWTTFHQPPLFFNYFLTKKFTDLSPSPPPPIIRVIENNKKNKTNKQKTSLKFCADIKVKKVQQLH